MSLEHIRNAVWQKAREEAERIEAEAQARRGAALAAARKALDEEFARRTEQARQEAERQERRRVIARRAEHNLALLTRRNRILDDVFEKATERLVNLPDGEYVAVMEEWMAKLPPDVGGALLCNRRDAVRLAALVDRLNALRPEGAKLELRGEMDPLRGGAIFRAKKFEIDLSVALRVRQLRQALAPEVSRILFPGDVTV